jgi:UDP:flavonoid glycosyltransferase YjiC (YdhE family)
MTQFLITAIGSYGDVHPMVGLGTALDARGHRVKIVTNPYFKEVVENAGLELIPLSTREHYLEVSRHPDIWHPVRGPKLVLTHGTANLMRPLYELLVAHYVPGETVFCAHGMDLASRVAGEKLGVPVAGVFYAPMMFWTIHDSPRLKGMLLAPWVPKRLKQLQFRVSDALFVKPLLGPSLNALRADLGLAPVNRIFSEWLHETDVNICLFPDWFGPPQPDWPSNARVVGFPLWDSDFAATLSEEVCEFLGAGTPPIVFSPGSANHEAHSFFAAAVDTCQRLGCRGILLTKYAHQLPVRMPDTVRHYEFEPLSKLLPRTAAMVHHGGIGTCAQGLAAGIPQIVRPMSYDQFDNSRRLVRLGVAKEISVRHFHGRSIAAALGAMLDSPALAARCRELSARCDGTAALDAACDALEQLSK